MEYVYVAENEKTYSAHVDGSDSRDVLTRESILGAYCVDGSKDSLSLEGQDNWDNWNNWSNWSQWRNWPH